MDLPQVNGFSVQQPTSFSVGENSTGNHVQFNSIAQVKTYKVVEPQQQNQFVQAQRPKHKARRRARVPKLELVTGGGEDAIGKAGDVGKPASPSKLKKMMEKDRHSRSGRRGLPKKGERKMAYAIVHVYCVCSALFGAPSLLFRLVIALCCCGWQCKAVLTCKLVLNNIPSCPDVYLYQSTF